MDNPKPTSNNYILLTSISRIFRWWFDFRLEPIVIENNRLASLILISDTLRTSLSTSVFFNLFSVEPRGSANDFLKVPRLEKG